MEALLDKNVDRTKLVPIRHQLPRLCLRRKRLLDKKFTLLRHRTTLFSRIHGEIVHKRLRGVDLDVGLLRMQFMVKFLDVFHMGVG